MLHLAVEHCWLQAHDSLGRVVVNKVNGGDHIVGTRTSRARHANLMQHLARVWGRIQYGRDEFSLGVANVPCIMSES